MDRKNVIGILVVLCFTGLSLAACVSAQLQVSYETTTPVSAVRWCGVGMSASR